MGSNEKCKREKILSAFISKVVYEYYKRRSGEKDKARRKRKEGRRKERTTEQKLKKAQRPMEN